MLPLASSTGRLLLSLRPGWLDPGFGDTWAAWGGHQKLNESDQQTAAREFNEETKFVGSLMLVKSHLYHSPDQNFQYQNFIGIIPDEFTPELDLATEEYRWVTMSELYGKSTDKLHLHPGFAEFVVESKSLLEQIVKGLGILNESI